MTNTTLNIPEKINVGFQERKGTYTGRLAYIIYYDNKGVLRKERSWDGWRDKNIPNEEFDNVPTDGFVLNKKVGDYNSRYGGRSAWIRIYDPRGFEFEISVNNLIFILEECSSIKGKGLEGEFIYAWDRSDLVLLPVHSHEYKMSSEFTALQTKKVGRKDMEEGCLYKTKDNETLMYLGKHEWWEPSLAYYGRYRDSNFGYKKLTKKSHVYWNIDNKQYITKPGFTWLAEKLDDVGSPDFAKRYSDYKKSKYSGSFSKFAIQKKKALTNGRFSAFVKVGDEYFHANVHKEYSNYSKYRFSMAKGPAVMDEESIDIPRAPSIGFYGYDRREQGEVLSKERLHSMHFYDIFIEAENGDRTLV